jgi:hypothetical protein
MVIESKVNTLLVGVVEIVVPHSVPPNVESTPVRVSDPVIELYDQFRWVQQAVESCFRNKAVQPRKLLSNLF